MGPGILTCKHSAGLLERYLQGSLSRREVQLIRDHLCYCEPCSILFRSARDTMSQIHGEEEAAARAAGAVIAAA